MLDRRFQILLDNARYQRLAAAASSRGVSVGALIREAIDQAFPETSERKTRALGQVLAAPDMPVPDPVDLKRELEDIRGRHG